ncbi:MAG TPA: hypothetical protein VIK18_10925 [Pirellulales bacterium]
MTGGTTRAEFEQLIDLRLLEAKALLDRGYWDGAYYLAGYSIEYALKIRLIAELMRSNSFPDRLLAAKFYQHNLQELRKLARMEGEMDADPALKIQWAIVRDWSEQSRYASGKTEKEARELLDAIENGVLPWIKHRS